MAEFEFGGPPRFAHQKRGLKKLIDCKGVGALLMEPGTGKTAVTLDYCSLLALAESAPPSGRARGAARRPPERPTPIDPGPLRPGGTV